MKARFLLLSATLVLGAQTPQLYRWRDRQGKEHVTNTPPPSNATPLAVPPLENRKEEERPKAPAPPKPSKSARPSETDPAEEAYWLTLGARLREAQARQDRGTLEQGATDLMRRALWGEGLWALVLLPLATLALVGLLGWWGGSALGGWGGRTLTAGCLLLGVGLAHVGLVQFVYGPQAARLRSAATALQRHMGEPPLAPRAPYLELQAQAASLQDGLHPLTPPWRFPERVMAFRRALRRALVSP